MVDLGLLAHEAASELVALTGLDALGRPMGIWRSALPVEAAMKSVLRHARVGILAERWFSQSEFRVSRELWKSWCFTRYAVAMSRRRGRPFPMPEYVPLAQALVVARWLAQKKAQGTPGYLDVAVSSACACAWRPGSTAWISPGRCFRVGSEPFTQARARIIAEAGCRALCHYHLAEVGRLGVACTAPAAVDEVHVVTDSIALLQRERSVAARRRRIVLLHPAPGRSQAHGECGARRLRCAERAHVRLPVRSSRIPPTSAHHPELREADD